MSGSATWLPICIAKTVTQQTLRWLNGLARMAFISSSVINYKGICKPNMIRMQSTILVILPTWAAFPLSLSLPPQILPKSTLSQRTVNKTQQNILRQPEAKHGFLCYIVRLRVIIKALLKQISLCLLSHFRIRIIALTCPDNKSARNHQRKSCVPAKSYKSQWCEANVISIEIFAPFQFVAVHVKTREYQTSQ